MKKKIILAYTGSLDTTAIIPWLKENHECEVIAVCVDVGQKADWKGITKRAMAVGASACHIADVKKDYVEQYVWPALKAGAVYEDKYLLGTAISRPLIAKVLVEYARSEKAAIIAHGATGKGNDQVRLDLGITALAPDLEIIAPWRVWKLKSREEVMRFLKRRKLPIPVEKKNSYNIDDNLLSVSYEGLELEDPSNEPSYKKILSMTVSPEKAPNKTEYIEIEFEKGIPVALNGKKMEGITLINSLNKIGGANGIGITDLIENRVTGVKCRSVYENPGAAILYYAHQELQRLCLDRQTYIFKQQVSLKISEIIYGGLWFTPLREALSAFVDNTQEGINGKVKLKLYKGSINPAGICSPNSLYNANLENLSTGDFYSQADAKGFVKLCTVPLLTRSLAKQPVSSKSSTKPTSGASKKSSGKSRKTTGRKK
jgi:argininosuccinate synthase